jgi:hypothetical protein
MTYPLDDTDEQTKKGTTIVLANQARMRSECRFWSEDTKAVHALQAKYVMHL